MVMHRRLGRHNRRTNIRWVAIQAERVYVLSQTSNTPHIVDKKAFATGIFEILEPFNQTEAIAPGGVRPMPSVSTSQLEIMPQDVVPP